MATETLLSSPVTDLLGQTDLSSGRRRASCLSSDLKTVRNIMASIQGADHHITAELQQAIVAEALKKKIRHRQRCRINQARYRQRQMHQENQVEGRIAKLRSEIKELESKFKNLIRPPPTPTSWALASEYFRQLNCYLSSPRTMHKIARQFLRETMAFDVIDGSLFGVNAQLENWRLFALYFTDARVDLKGLKTPTSDTLIAGTVTSLTITEKTVSLMFPHLNSDGVGGPEGGVWSPRAVRLLNQKIVMDRSVLLRWDSTTGKLSSIHSQADMISPMLELLGSLEDVSSVFYKARVRLHAAFTDSDTIEGLQR
ncbi:hypothetical protein GN958_ATG03281 [Phytophthora infestans]|uniref:BZIP transcription factor 1 n=1 Tax=Phytophthora infestans TaxID=4787 RepID=A0A8S9V3T9_PHYIN|nr:hypothetical protein GN958_ATG03281 [Phytophthora infestans]